MDIYHLAKNPRFKKLAVRIGLVLAVAGVYKANQSAWESKMERQQESFAKKEILLREEISRLKVQANPFRFWAYDSNGVKVKDLEAINQEKFVNNRKFAYKIRTPQKLTPALLEASESLRDRKGRLYTDYSRQELKAAVKENKAEMLKVLEGGNPLDFIEPGERFLDLSRARMFKLNGGKHGYHNHLLKKTSAELEKIPANAFADMVIGYREVSAYLKGIKGELELEYQREVEQDSLAFEDRKAAQRDSLVKEATKPKLPVFDWGAVMKGQRNFGR